ncbi:MAG TPA: hypothetical protein VH643_22945 [Gemmataceae bacterium]|jgi:hypothetical protein
MKAPELRTHLNNLLSETEAATEIAKTAERNKKSIGGHGPYADRFHAALLSITGTERKVRPHLNSLGLAAEDLAQFDDNLTILKGTVTKAKGRVAAQRALKLVCETVILPKADGMTASPSPCCRWTWYGEPVATWKPSSPKSTVAMNTSGTTPVR